MAGVPLIDTRGRGWRAINGPFLFLFSVNCREQEPSMSIFMKKLGLPQKMT